MINSFFYSFIIYRIKIRVIDSSDSTMFLLFDRDATILLKKSCVDMLHNWIN